MVAHRQRQACVPRSENHTKKQSRSGSSWKIAQRVEHPRCGIVLHSSSCGLHDPERAGIAGQDGRRPRIAAGDRREEERIRLPDQSRCSADRSAEAPGALSGSTAFYSMDRAWIYFGSSNRPRSHESESATGAGRAARSGESGSGPGSRWRDGRLAGRGRRTVDLQRSGDRRPAREHRDSRHEGRTGLAGFILCPAAAYAAAAGTPAASRNEIRRSGRLWPPYSWLARRCISSSPGWKVMHR